MPSGKVNYLRITILFQERARTSYGAELWKTLKVNGVRIESIDQHPKNRYFKDDDRTLRYRAHSAYWKNLPGQVLRLRVRTEWMNHKFGTLDEPVYFTESTVCQL